MALNDILTQLQTIAGTMSGIRYAPTGKANPPDGVNVFPAVVSYPSAFAPERSFSRNVFKYTIVTELHFERNKTLPLVVYEAAPYAEMFFDLIVRQYPTLNDTVSHVILASATFGNMEWGAMETIGWRFSLTVTEGSFGG